MDKDKYDSGSRGRSQRRKAHRNIDEKFQYLLKAEEQILQAISARAPLPGVLNGICSALDCQIGNMVSLISLPKDDTSNLAEIARNAELFGLHIFFSAGVVAASGEELGSLEMYCCLPRSPSFEEFQLIERATCLAAIAIKRYNEAGDDGNCRIHRHRPARRYVPEWPVCMN
jgi:hypothetical protein